MSELIKKINSFFKVAVKSDVEKIKSEIILSERQALIFEYYYIKKYSITYIADKLCVCNMVINNELKNIRNKILKVL